MLIQPVLRPVLQPVLRSIFDPGIGGGGTPIWTPASLFAASEQGVWLDESDLSTMFQDLAGTVPAAVDSPVGKRLDKSGNNNHWTATNASARPVLRLTAGKYSLEWDGVDDEGATESINFAVTDKMTVLMGLRKLSDATSARPLQLSSNTVAAPGTFCVFAPDTPTSSYLMYLHGNTGATYYYTTGFAAPITNVLATAFDMAGSTRATNIPVFRVNAATPALTGAGSNTGVGGGTFGAFKLFAGAAGLFTGHTYQEIVRGAASTLAEIEAAETYVNDKTGAY